MTLRPHLRRARLPAAAAELVRHLDPACPREPPSIYGAELISRWETMVRLMLGGMRSRPAQLKSGFDHGVVKHLIRLEPVLAKHYAYLRDWRRRGFSQLAVEDMLRTISTSNLSLKAACDLHGVPYEAFKALTMRNRDIWARYERAKALQQRWLIGALRDDARVAMEGAASRGELRQTMRRFNKEHLVVHKLKTQRQRRIEARAYRASRAAKDPVRAQLVAARRRAKKR